MVFKLVRSGNAARLRDLLDTLKEDMLKLVFNATEPKENGANPLIIGARSGHNKVVEVLLEKGADPHATGTVAFDGEIITRVPPLWAAAAAGHLEVCQLLISVGVEVNQTTNTNSTPLRGACYDGHLEIVKFLVENGADIEIANRHGHTALMIASYREKANVVRYLLSVGAQINRTSVKGNTVLHDAAEAGNLEILKMLIDAGAKMQPDDYGVTPLLSAALCGHMDLMPLLFKYANNREKHDAWKLIGATLVDKRLDLGGAILCWKNSFASDIWTTVEESASEFIVELNDMQKRIYSGFQEAKSLVEVNELIGDPDAIRMQALIIRERILGDSHPDTHHYLRLRGAYYLDIGSWNRTWELWSYILQLEQFHHHPMSLATGSTFCAFYDALNIMVEDLMMRPDRRQLNRNFNPTIEQVAVVLDRAIYEAERFLFADEESRKDNLWVDERSIQQELENLLVLSLQFIHLVSRVNLINVSQPDSTPKSNGGANIRMAPLLPSRSNMGRSEGPASGGASLSYRNNAALNICASLSPAPSQQSFRQISQKRQPIVAPGEPSYTITNTIDRMCSCAYLPRELEPFQKIDMDGLQPRCQHLKCLVHRLLSVFTKLGLNPLHVACEEREMRDDMETAPRIPAFFVIEKLLQVGADPTKADENGNTPLHIFLKSSYEKYAIIRLLLEWGAPLFARNHQNEVCFETIQQKANLVQNVRIGRYVSLKQVAGSVMKRSGFEAEMEVLPAELKQWLAIF